MSAPAVREEDIARYLRDHPEFFGAHPELLASITMPHPHGGRAISLHERQLEVLREKNRGMERKLAELIRVAQENDAIGDKLLKWTRQLLLTADAERLPQAVIDGMQALFSVPHVALRLWGLRESFRGLPFASPVAADAIALANSMKQPYCGPNADFHAATWLPDGGAATRSIALLPLRRGAEPDAFGLLVLGSADPSRFEMNMGTAYLERIAELASATLSRLVE
jgi:uncharacterized protein YigA (DUF484 family)